MDKEKLAKDALIYFKENLLKILPLQNEVFLAKLEKAELLPDNSGASIQAKATREEKVSYFLENVVRSAPHIYLPILIDVMDKHDNLAVKELASEMKKYMGSGNIYIGMFDDTIKATCIYVLLE